MHLHFLYPDVRGDSSPIVDERLAREQTRGVAIGAHSAMKYIEGWELSIGQRKECSYVAVVTCRAGFRREFAVDPMDIVGWDARGRQQRIIR